MRFAMTRSALLLALSAGCAGDPAPPVETGPVHQVERQLTRAADDLGPAAAEHVAAAVALSADDALEPVSVAIGMDGLRHARLQQVHGGVPVFGSEVLVHADDTTFLGFNGTITSNLDGFDLEPTVDAGAAVAIARDRLALDRGADETSALVILPRDEEGEGADLAWRIDVDGWTAFVGARNGALLRSYTWRHTVEQGSGPGGNQAVARTWSQQIDVEADGGDYVLDTDRLQTLDRAGGDQVVRGPLDNLPDPAANDAQGFAEITLAMLRDWMGSDSIDGNGMKIVSMVHDPDVCRYGPDNACWDGGEERMKYGDGASLFFPLSGGLDVVAHEINHGFTQHHAGLIYYGMPGGLNESFSDIAGTATEFFHESGGADFAIAEDVTQSGTPLRDMCEPTCKDPTHPCLGASIDHVKNYDRHIEQDQNGNDVVVEHEMHSSSGIGNKAFCLATGRFLALSGGATIDAVRDVARAWYAAQDGRWNATTTFSQACQGVVDGARALGYSDEQVLAIAQSWADVGVFCKSGTDVCVEDGTCDVAAGETCASCPSDCDTCAEACSRFRKGKCKVGIGDCSQCGDPSCGDGICDHDEDDQNCGQDCGCAAPGEHCDAVAPFGCFCDQYCAATGDCCADKEQVCGP